jgi:predicted phosphoribosyltransferase
VSPLFENRKEAGIKLAEKLEEHITKDTIVLAIPRGGVNIGYEIAEKYDLPLDVIIVKKIGYPGNPEYAIGAVSMDSSYMNPRHINISEDYVRGSIMEKQEEAKDRYEELRGDKPPLNIIGKRVILVDDGIATGATMKMAVQVVKSKSPEKVIVAVPVAPPSTVKNLREEADEVIALMEPSHFMAIGQFYGDFRQVPTEEAKRLLERI